MVKTRAKADLIRRLGGNSGLAFQLGDYQARFGDWRELFRDVEQHREGDRGGHPARRGQRRSSPANRTVGMLESTRWPSRHGGRTVMTPRSRCARSSLALAASLSLAPATRRARRATGGIKTPPLRAFQPAAAEARRARQRHGDLPSGGPRAAADPGDRSASAAARARSPPRRPAWSASSARSWRTGGTQQAHAATSSTTSSRRARRASRPAAASTRPRVALNCLKGDFDEVFAVFAGAAARSRVPRRTRSTLAKTQIEHRHRPSQRRPGRHPRPRGRASWATAPIRPTRAQPNTPRSRAITRDDLAGLAQALRPPEQHHPRRRRRLRRRAMEAKLRKAFGVNGRAGRRRRSRGIARDAGQARRLLRRQGRRDPGQHRHGPPGHHARTIPTTPRSRS